MPMNQALEVAAIGMAVVVATLLFLAGVFSVLMGALSGIARRQLRPVVPTVVPSGGSTSRELGRETPLQEPADAMNPKGSCREFRVKVQGTTFHIDIEEL